MTPEEKDKISFHKARLNLPDKEALRNISEEKRKQLHFTYYLN